jgi:hypothetical protein
MTIGPISCAEMSKPPWRESHAPYVAHMKSFLGVKFGERLDDVQREFPNGVRETSPQGAPSYRVDNLALGNIRYRSVIYEFTDTDGMELAFGYFDPAEDAVVLSQTEQILGPPDKVARIDPVDASQPDASWTTRNGSVTLSTQKHRIVMLSSQGAVLADDIKLRP